MKKFIVRFLFFMIPILGMLIFMECLLRSIPNDYSYKSDYLKNHSEGVEVLFLGSSHTYYGINPKYISQKTFNASHISQTLDVDFQLVDDNLENLKSLKYLVIPVDYFSLYTKLSESKEAWRLKNYNIYYGLNLSVNPKDYLELLSFKFQINIERIINYYFNKKNYVTCSDLGYGVVKRKQKDLIETGIEASKRHTADNDKYLMENIDVINDIVSLAKSKDVNVIFYTTPAYKSYREGMDSDQYFRTIKVIDSIANAHKNCYYFNLISDDKFKADDFRDADHLNKKGAKKLSQILNNKLEYLISINKNI